MLDSLVIWLHLSMSRDKFMRRDIVDTFLKFLDVVDHADNFRSIFNQIVTKVHIPLHRSSIEHKVNVINVKFLPCDLLNHGQNLLLDKLTNGLIMFR